MSGEIESRFEAYLQSHIHPDVQPEARRLTHPTLGKISMESYLEMAEHIHRNHLALDEQLEAESAIVDATERFRTEL